MPTGKVWTVTLRDDARWHDGEPVTADDVVFTIQTLQDPDYTGPAASSWGEVTVAAVGRQDGHVHARHAARWVPAGPDPADRAGPPAGRRARWRCLPDHPFGEQPVGAGPFELVDLTSDGATLVPATTVAAGGEPGAVDVTPPPDSLTTAPPTLRPERPLPYLAGHRLPVLPRW